MDISQDTRPVPDHELIRLDAAAHPEFVWLNRLQCLAVGEFDSESSRAGWDVYAVQ